MLLLLLLILGNENRRLRWPMLLLFENDNGNFAVAAPPPYWVDTCTPPTVTLRLAEPNIFFSPFFLPLLLVTYNFFEKRRVAIVDKQPYLDILSSGISTLKESSSINSDKTVKTKPTDYTLASVIKLG